MEFASLTDYWFAGFLVSVIPMGAVFGARVVLAMILAGDHHE